jgi:hypothetical protein
MHSISRKIFSCVIVICFALAGFAGAKSKPKATPVPRSEEDRIISVSSSSISIQHEHWAKSFDKKETKETVTKNYKITNYTEILVNGEKAKVGDLKAGMAVSVDATAASGLDKPDPSDGGVANTINAHPAPTEPKASPTPKKK